MLFIITGRPGIGKSTVCRKVIDLLREQGFKIGGVICPEVRVGRSRIGFKIIDLMSNKEGWLAHINFNTGIKVGRYHVNLNDLESIGISAINNAINQADVIVIDEIGPMELKSMRFKEMIFKAFNCEKPIISVVHWKLSRWLISATKHLEVKVYEVTFSNRNWLHELIFKEILKKKLRRHTIVFSQNFNKRGENKTTNT